MSGRIRHIERALLAVTTIGYFLGGYLILGATTPEAPATLRTAFDDAVPFLPWTVLIYSAVYTAAFYPLFVVRCPRLFRRVAVAYALVLTVAFVTFAVFPVTAIGLRPDLTGLDETVFWNFGMRMTYEVDPPTNLFPSLHLGMAWIASLGAWKARRLYGLFGFAGSIAIGISTWTVKQHWVADSVYAVVLAHVAYFIAVRGYNSAAVRRRERAYNWRGPVLFTAMLALVYVGYYLWFRLAT